MSLYEEYIDFLNCSHHEIGDRHPNGDGLITEMTLISEYFAYVHSEYITDVYDKQKDITKNGCIKCLENYYYLGKTYDDYDFVILENFPEREIKLLINHFINDFTYNNVYIEVVKYLYKNWNNKIFQKEIREIEKFLTEFGNMTEKQYDDIVHNRPNNENIYTNNDVRKLQWLSVFYPLINNWENIVLNLIKKTHLFRNKYWLLEGLFNTKPNKLKIIYKEILLNLNKYKNDQNKINYYFNLWTPHYSILLQNCKIIKKINSIPNYDIFSDEDLKEYWSSNHDKLENIIEILKTI